MKVDIQGYEGLYQVDTEGNIYSSKTLKCKAHRPNSSGYMYVNLWKNNKGKNEAVHRLVALHFIPNPTNKPQVNHIDGNKSNNNIDNLEWVTNSENQLHAHRILNVKKAEMLGLKSGKKNSTGFQGVRIVKSGRYSSRFRPTGEKEIYIGTFDTAEEAHNAYVKATNQYKEKRKLFKITEK